jgi:hypothetical protein
VKNLRRWNEYLATGGISSSESGLTPRRPVQLLVGNPSAN